MYSIINWLLAVLILDLGSMRLSTTAKYHMGYTKHKRIDACTVSYSYMYSTVWVRYSSTGIISEYLYSGMIQVP